MLMLRMLAFRPGAAPAKQLAAKVAPATLQQNNSGQKKAAAPARKQVQAAAAAPKDSGLSADNAEAWSTIAAALDLKGMAGQMAQNCAFHGMDNDVVRLSLDPAHSYLLNKERSQQLETALCAHFQRAVTVKITKEDDLPHETPAGKRVREQDERQRQAVASIEGDENIRAIQDAFGGAVQMDSIRPK